MFEEYENSWDSRSSNEFQPDAGNALGYAMDTGYYIIEDGNLSGGDDLNGLDESNT